jgi:hypothetical protein
MWVNGQKDRSNLAGLVLGHFVLRVFLAVFPFAIRASGLGDVDLRRRNQVSAG